MHACVYTYIYSHTHTHIHICVFMSFCEYSIAGDKPETGNNGSFKGGGLGGGGTA